MRNRYLVQRVRSGVMEGRVHSDTEDTHSASGQDDHESEAEILSALSCYEEVLEHSSSDKKITKEKIEELKEEFREIESYLMNIVQEMERKYVEEMNILKQKNFDLDGQNKVLDLKNGLLELELLGKKIPDSDLEMVYSRLDEIQYREKVLNNEVISLIEISKEQRDYIYSLRNEITKLGGTPPDEEEPAEELSEKVSMVLRRYADRLEEHRRLWAQDEDVPKVTAKEHQRQRGQDKDVPTVTARVVREQRERQRQQRE
jgi:hypothetical protein